MRTELNCVSFAYYRLGITQEERYLDPLKVDLMVHFFEVETPEEADAVAVIFHDPLEGEVLYHLGVLDPRDRMLVHHRPDYGRKACSTVLPILEKTYPGIRFSLRYLKLKDR